MPQKQPAEELLLDTAALRHATHTAWPPPHQLPSFPEIRKSHYAVATLYIFTTAHAKAACKPDLDQLLTFRDF